MSNTDNASSATGGFGKMLNSLHGLEQRLAHFSVTDVDNAEANAQTLILRLRQWQGRIDAVASLKQVAVAISQSIAEIPQLDSETATFDSLENHPQLHAIVKASKLIKMHKLMAALKVGTSDNELIANLTGQATKTALKAMDWRPTEAGSSDAWDSALPESKLTKPLPDTAQELGALSAATVNESMSAPLADSLLRNPLTEADQRPLELETLTDFPTAQAEFESAVASHLATSAPAGNAQSADFPAPNTQAKEAKLAGKRPIAESSSSFVIPDTPRSSGTTPRPKINQSRANKPNKPDDSKPSIQTDANFDFRLLDELVSNYGEFTTFPNSPVTSEEDTQQTLEPAATPVQEEFHRDQREAIETNASVDYLASNSGEFTAQVNLPEIITKDEIETINPTASLALEDDAEQPTAGERNAPILRRDGDLDRQFKKIIKDYGEYDLYSDEQTINLKKVGIVAIVVLGLVFGGIYFFKAPSTPTKTAPAAANSSTTATQEDRKSRPGAQEANGGNRDRSLGSIPNVEKPTAKNK